MKKVCVLLSTYNGEKFLVEQLESIRNQEGVIVDCFIRDDGSKDGTLSILAKYTQNHSNFYYYSGQNVGVVRSFNELINKAEDKYDYFSFSDQDDIWKADKLITAVTVLDKLPSNQPLLYCSNLTSYCEDGTKSDIWNVDYDLVSQQILLVQNWAWGCTEVFNQKAKILYKQSMTDNISMHDYWMHLICKFMGSVVYDKESHIYYRQHGSNVVGNKEFGIKHISSYLRRFREENDVHRSSDATLFVKSYGKLLNPKDYKYFAVLSNYKDSFLKKIELLFCKELHMLTIPEDIAYRIRIIRNLE